MSLTKQDMKNFRKKAEIALEKLGEETGFKLEIGDISFSPDGFKTRMTAIKVNPGETDSDIEKKAFIRDCWRYGLNETHYGAEFKYVKKTYKIIGVKPRAQKNTILAKEIVSGSVYAFPHELVQKFLEAPKTKE